MVDGGKNFRARGKEMNVVDILNIILKVNKAFFNKKTDCHLPNVIFLYV